MLTTLWDSEPEKKWSQECEVSRQVAQKSLIKKKKKKKKQFNLVKQFHISYVKSHLKTTDCYRWENLKGHITVYLHDQIFLSNSLQTLHVHLFESHI